MSERPTDPAILSAGEEEGFERSESLTLGIATDMPDEKPKATEARTGKEASEAFKEAVDRITAAALGEIKKRFDDRPKREGEEWNRWEYHNSGHTRDVMQRTRTILEAAGADERTILLGELAAAAHDIIQLWEVQEKPLKVVKVSEGKKPAISAAGEVQAEEIPREMLVRDFGNNEASSAEWVVEQMRMANKSGQGEILTENEIAIVAEAIIATIPLFEGGAVIQPYVFEDSHVTAAAVALADLGEAGVGMPSTFIEGSCALFREENLDIAHDLLEKRELPGPETKEQYRKRMLNWIEGQQLFIAQQEVNLERALRAIPEGGRDKVRGLCGNFQAAKDRMSEIYDALKGKDFEDIAAYMGYGRPEEVKAARESV